VKHLTTIGTFRFKTRLLFIANALRFYHIGRDEEADGVWSIYFGEILLAKRDGRDYIIRERSGTLTKCYPCPRIEALRISAAVHAT
jgi:hypothetical protein